jgi:hypothetical protein
MPADDRNDIEAAMHIAATCLKSSAAVMARNGLAAEALVADMLAAMCLALINNGQIK